ncbi:MAG TPA: tetratricopeptide repeat protein [Burkholderiales bacterium]|nr:tetratricopeptide repeat protein [Burkholderiales bacterium]
MALKDCRDLAVSTRNRVSLDRYEAALHLLHGYYGDPLAAIDRALEEDPEFVMGHCFRAALMVMSSDKGAEPMLVKSVRAAQGLVHRANERERMHIAAADAWLNGNFERSVRLYGDILVEYPRDALALQVAHVGDFFLGQSSMLRDRVAQVLPHWGEGVPGYGFVLGMHAFGLEETALYAQAEAAGRKALALNGRDPWAVHAVAHVMEMQGRFDEGIQWLNSRAGDWAPDNGLAYHNWWHLALFHMDRGEEARAVELYDTAVRKPGSNVVLEMVDASALLWRLHLRGADLGDRWKGIADAWEPRLEEGYYAFNDAHAMMAFVGAGRGQSAQRLLEVLQARAGAGGTNGRMTWEVGLPLCRALHAFGAGDYGTAVELLQPLRLVASRFGGSHAQRDIIPLTLVEAAIRGGRLPLARALLAERTSLKPESPFNWASTVRTLRMMGDRDGAENAVKRSITARATAVAAASTVMPLASAA